MSLRVDMIAAMAVMPWLRLPCRLVRSDRLVDSADSSRLSVLMLTVLQLELTEATAARLPAAAPSELTFTPLMLKVCGVAVAPHVLPALACMGHKQGRPKSWSVRLRV